MDKSKFTNEPTLDSEGFSMEIEFMQTASSWLQMHNQLHREAQLNFEARELLAEFGVLCGELPSLEECAENFLNPEGWQEVDGVKLPSVEAWADLNEVERKKAVADVLLHGARP